MKLIFKIAVGVFLGNLSSSLVMDNWHSYQENVIKQATEKRKAEQEKVRVEQGESIRAMFLQNHQINGSNQNKLPSGFIPDDAK